MLTFTLILSLLATGSSQKDAIDGLNSLLTRVQTDPDKFINEIAHSNFVTISPTIPKVTKRSSRNSEDILPLVFLHGMGDSCFNNGMQSITEESGTYMGVYSVCIPTGDTREEDTMNGFFMSMNENVDIFSEKVKADINLSHGFNCIGLSQGNNICRGYIQKYNDPPVNTHLSIHGPVGGVSALPHCYPDSSYVGETCQEISDLLSKFAYNSIIQDFLFQADYFRDINYINNTLYKHNSQIGNWNQEGYQYNTEYKINFNKTNKYAMIKANNDTIVVPRESEWWGTYDTDYITILTMKDTLWYQNDMFGLRTADENNKIIFNSTNGNHLDFTDEELYGWLDLYC